MYVDYMMSTLIIEYLYILLYYLNNHLFLILHSYSVELYYIRYDICFL